eukprot:9472412-Pyramimonas_sp.AAC.1
MKTYGEENGEDSEDLIKTSFPSVLQSLDILPRPCGLVNTAINASTTASIYIPDHMRARDRQPQSTTKQAWSRQELRLAHFTIQARVPSHPAPQREQSMLHDVPPPNTARTE